MTIVVMVFRSQEPIVNFVRRESDGTLGKVKIIHTKKEIECNVSYINFEVSVPYLYTYQHKTET